MTAPLEPTEAFPQTAHFGCVPDENSSYVRISIEPHDGPWAAYRLSRGGAEVLAAEILGTLRPSAHQEPDDDALEQIAEFLVEQRNEPWPGGADATRLHYWRDKAIEAARRLRALQAPETDYSGTVMEGDG